MTQADRPVPRDCYSPGWARFFGSVPASQWSVHRRAVHLIGITAFAPLIFFGGSESRSRGPWFGAGCALAYAAILGGPLVSARLADWWHRHPYLEAAMIGPLALLVAAVSTKLPLAWSTIAALLITATVLVLVRRARTARGCAGSSSSASI